MLHLVQVNIVNEKSWIEVIYQLTVIVTLLEALNLCAQLAVVKLCEACLINALQLHLYLVDFCIELVLRCGIATPQRCEINLQEGVHGVEF